MKGKKSDKDKETKVRHEEAKVLHAEMKVWCEEMKVWHSQILAEIRDPSAKPESRDPSAEPETRDPSTEPEDYMNRDTFESSIPEDMSSQNYRDAVTDETLYGEGTRKDRSIFLCFCCFS
jgi:hypothetical protein